MNKVFIVGLSALIFCIQLCIRIDPALAETTNLKRYILEPKDAVSSSNKLGLSAGWTLDDFIASLEQYGHQSTATVPEGAGRFSARAGDNPTAAPLVLVDDGRSKLAVELYGSQGNHTLYALCAGSGCANLNLRMANQTGDSNSLSLSSGLITTSLSVNGITKIEATDLLGNRISPADEDVLAFCAARGTPLANFGAAPTTFTVLDRLIQKLFGDPRFLPLLDQNHFLNPVYSVAASAVEVAVNYLGIIKSNLPGTIACSLSFFDGSGLTGSGLTGSGLTGSGLTEIVLLLQTQSPTTTAIQALKPVPPEAVENAFAFPAAGQGDYPQTSQMRMLATASSYTTSPDFIGMLGGQSQASITLKIIQPFTEADLLTGGCRPEPNIGALRNMQRLTTYMTSNQPLIGHFPALSATVTGSSVGNQTYPFVAGCRMAVVEGEFSVERAFLINNSDPWMAVTYDYNGFETFRPPAVGQPKAGGASIFLGNFLNGILTTTQVDTVDAMPFAQLVLYDLENL